MTKQTFDLSPYLPPEEAMEIPIEIRTRQRRLAMKVATLARHPDGRPKRVKVTANAGFRLEELVVDGEWADDGATFHGKFTIITVPSRGKPPRAQMEVSTDDAA
jgi:hypothetical protein